MALAAGFGGIPLSAPVLAPIVSTLQIRSAADLDNLPTCAVDCIKQRCSSMTDMDCICNLSVRCLSLVSSFPLSPW
ncbi:hypothetical protein CDD82_2963 [Ophiocordyceps australis]|uniref:Uncharacterized protein n=1 Tax=Ophiocordyceps australis TaxID=1399860 RepID=A0A2C5XUU2_9HYPO|nr:hypothetical protein CDD82_2963 [Ophiocordyceps australis]